MTDAYDKIDRFLRNNLDDSDYAEYSDALEEVFAARSALTAQPVAGDVTDAMVSRFLSWRLPADFSPDCGISFDGRGADARGYAKQWPTGTNLLTAEQARAMLDHVAAGDWRQYAKDGEDARQCIERHRSEQDALLSLLAKARATPPASAEVAPVAWRGPAVRGNGKTYWIYTDSKVFPDDEPLFTHPAAVPEAAVREWIGVDERLPELGTEVLVYKPACKWGEVQFDTWDEQYEAPLSFSSATIPTGPGWNNEDDFYAITHWMPLPPPPSQAIAAHQEQPK